MPIRIELVDANVVTDGLNLWWDDFEAALEGRHHDFPLLAKVDPYGDLDFAAGDLSALADELVRVTQTGLRRDQSVVKLQQLVCEAMTSGAVLRFRGD